MKVISPIKPSKAITNAILDNIGILDEFKIKFLRSVLDNDQPITDHIAIGLASAFATAEKPVTTITVGYWRNIQLEWDAANSTEPLQDVAKLFTSTLAAFKHVNSTKEPVYINNVIEQQVEPIYLLSKQAYLYLISKCTQDEAWDLGWLGQSEQHAKKVPMPEAIKRAIQHHQQNKG